MPHRDEKLFPLILDAFDYSKDGIAILTIGEQVLYHNKAWNEIHALDPDVDLTGSTLKEFELEKTFPLIDEAKRILFTEGAYSSQMNITRRDGAQRDLHILATFISHTQPPLIVAVLRDVTDLVKAESDLKEVEQRYRTVSELTEKLQDEIAERQRVEKALRDSEEKIRLQYRSIPVPTYTWQSSGDEMILVNFNDAAEKITHGKIKDYMGITAHKLFADSPEYVEQLERCLAEKSSFESETDYHYRSTGEVKILHVKFTFVEPDLVLVHTDDVTARREVEKDLIKYRDHLQELVDERTEELRWLTEKLQHEISERKQAQEALKESELLYRWVSEIASDFSYSILIKEDGSLVYEWATDAVTRITGYSVEELIEIGGRAGILFPEDKNIVADHVKNSIERRKSHCEFRIVNKNGSIRWLSDHSRPITDPASGRVVQILGAVQDITERKLAQEGLERRHGELEILYRLHEIAVSSNDRQNVFDKIMKPIGDYFSAETIAVYDIDEENRDTMLLTSMGLPPEAAEKVRHVSMDDAAVKAALSSPDVIVTEDDLPKDANAREDIKKQLGIKKTLVFLVRIKNQVNSLVIIGSSKDIELTQEKKDFLKMFGHQLGFALERLELLDDLARSGRELQDLTTKLFDTIEEERRLMAVRLHEGMAQSLVALNMNFDSLADRLRADDVEGNKLLEMMRKRLHEVTTSTKMISKSLHPVMLEELGLVDAIKAYVDKFIRNDDLVVELTEIGFDKKLSQQLSLTLFRICQEALLNVVKHAGAKKVAITLTKGYPDVIMIIQDDGKGFSLDSKSTRLKGFGISGMKERVRRLSGEFQIRSKPTEGTRIRVTLPLEESNGKRRKDTSR